MNRDEFLVTVHGHRDEVALCKHDHEQREKPAKALAHVRAAERLLNAALGDRNPRPDILEALLALQGAAAALGEPVEPHMRRSLEMAILVEGIRGDPKPATKKAESPDPEAVFRAESARLVPDSAGVTMFEVSMWMRQLDWGGPQLTSDQVLGLRRGKIPLRGR